MTGRYVLSPRAQGDIDDIWEYTEKRWGFDQAESYIGQIRQHIEAVARKPTIGRDAQKYGPAIINTHPVLTCSSTV